MGLGSLVSGELAQLRTMTLSPNTFAVLALSCVIGVLISYSGFRCRSAVSATCFTVLGVGCKFATVLANVLLWDKHASLQGITCLVLTLMTASLYSQAPMRSERDSKPVRQVLTIAALALTSGGAVTVGYKMAAPSAVVQVPRCGLQHVESCVEGRCASEQLRRSERVLCAELYTGAMRSVICPEQKRSKARC